MEGQQQIRNVLVPPPMFMGVQLNSKIFEGETLQQLLERSEEARAALGIRSAADAAAYTYHRRLADGIEEAVALDAPVLAGASYTSAPRAEVGCQRQPSSGDYVA